jgi:two-component sensor histidine kinase
MKIETKLKMTAEAETLKLQTKIKQQQDMIRKQQERLQVAEAQIQAAREEEEVLRQEVHHRVKNNLQIILSMLSLYTGNNADPEIEAVLKNMHSRVATISLIHKQLYDSSSLAEIDMQAYVNSQIKDLLAIYPVRTKKIVVKLDIGEVVLEVDRAINFALLINELVVNAIWHAFIERENGTLEVGLTESEDGTLRLLVADDGVGLPEEIDISQTSTIGLRMAYNFILRLKGELSLIRSAGTRFCIDFPKHSSF